MSEFFKTIREADAAIKAKELEKPAKVETVEIAARKLSTVLHSYLAHTKLHTTTKRFIERESKLTDALFFALERILEVKTYSHYLKREDLEKLRNTKVTLNEVNEILEKLNTGLVVYHSSENISEKERIVISQLQEIVATYLTIIENNATCNQ